MTDWSRLTNRLAQRQQQQLMRQRNTLETAQSAKIICNGEKLLNFCSNDYLGLANHPKVVAALQQAAEKYGVGSGASHLVNGHSTLHHQLEEALAEFTGRQRALLFSTGYMANVGVISALVEKGDLVLQDKLNHASLIDGGLLSGARFTRYLHNDVASLTKKLQQHQAGQQLIVTDGVFSMDGDIAPLTEIAALAKQHNAWLMVDDAHGIGCLGPNGEGAVAEAGLSTDDVPILVGTFGKALGTAGAFVAGDEVLIESLIQFARPYIYTTAMPPAIAAATLASLKLVQTESWRREKLQQNISQFRSGASQLGLQLMESTTAIQPIVVGDAEAALKLSQQLKSQGVMVTAIRPPTVPAGTARLRITLSASHSEQQVNQLLESLEQACKQFKATSSQLN
ncbi:8-amino-7-oxononanoate synthase [Endozoicomonas sp. SM1973]|uniref:8-amino-7-oxononanoate synthase n=1 Tax=Spartinivicinus marinus TaxID=2994442 RepID=A0A853II46_9GAMM|nr:8-amino-7-oxononanoate synthase [Spartinivicinus marinus]MCX4026379.1 8-amino-7-oxononanoate synthase [Spartinivicinus marinus]NYZ67276.1 8-amino-7-oxononanoate synthase [Spartinivicinus marinus]